MLILPKMIRANPLVFGWESFFDNLLTLIRPARLPTGAQDVTMHELPRPKPGLFELRHSLIYYDELVLSTMTDWILRTCRAGK